MSIKSKFSVKNVTSGLKSLSELLTGHVTQHHKFSRLAPRTNPIRKPNCNYIKQVYVQKNTSIDITKSATLTPPSGESALKRICSELPLHGTRLDTLNFRSVRLPVHGFPWSSTYRYYYDVPKPQCPPAAPKPCGKDSDQRGSSGCPPLKRTMPSKRNPCGGQSGTPKRSPCTRKMSTFVVPLNIYRFYCSGCKKPPKCPPRGGGGAAKGPGKGPVCPPQKKVPDCSGGAKKGGGRPRCPPRGKKAGGKGRCGPKKKAGGGGRSKCTPKKSGGGARSKCKSRKGGGGGGSRSKCRSTSKPRKCTPKGSGGSKSRCAPKKSGGGSKSKCKPRMQPRKCTPKSSGGSKSRCGPKKSGGGSKSKCQPKSQPRKCTPKKSSSKKSRCGKGSSGGSAKPKRCTPKRSGGGGSGGKCKPNIKRAPTCAGKKKGGRSASKCQRKGPPKKPKC